MTEVFRFDLPGTEIERINTKFVRLYGIFFVCVAEMDTHDEIIFPNEDRNAAVYLHVRWFHMMLPVKKFHSMKFIGIYINRKESLNCLNRAHVLFQKSNTSK